MAYGVVRHIQEGGKWLFKFVFFTLKKMRAIFKIHKQIKLESFIFNCTTLFEIYETKWFNYVLILLPLVRNNSALD